MGVLAWPKGDGVNFSNIIMLLSEIFKVLMPLVTPALKEELKEALLSLLEKSRRTPNPWDDFVILFLMRALGMQGTVE